LTGFLVMLFALRYVLFIFSSSVAAWRIVELAAVFWVF